MWKRHTYENTDPQARTQQLQNHTKLKEKPLRSQASQAASASLYTCCSPSEDSPSPLSSLLPTPGANVLNSLSARRKEPGSCSREDQCHGTQRWPLPHCTHLQVLGTHCGKATDNERPLTSPRSGFHTPECYSNIISVFKIRTHFMYYKI